MNYKLLIVSTIFTVSCFNTKGHGRGEKKNDKIIIEGDVPTSFKPKIGSLGNTFEMSIYAIGDPSVYPEPITLKEKIIGGRVKWVIPTNKSVVLLSDYLGKALLGSPGDSIHIEYDNNNERVYSGKGWEKYELQYKIDLLKLKLKRPTKHPLFITKATEYLQLNSYLDNLLESIISLINSYKNKIKSQEYYWIKTHAIELIEFNRVEGFQSFSEDFVFNGAKKTSLLLSDLTALWDSTQYKPFAVWLRKQSYHNGESPLYFYFFTRQETWRKFDFNLNHDSLNSSGNRRLRYFQMARRNYQGISRERTLAYIVADEVIKELGFSNPATQLILKSYYNEPGFPEYKSWVKNYEKTTSNLRAGKRAPDFTLEDYEGNFFTKNSFKGKITLMDFWYTGCKGCIEMIPSLLKIEEAFKGDTLIQFVSISTDTDKEEWIRSVAQKKYTTNGSVKLYTQGMSINHPMISRYNISSFPELVLIGADPDGRIIEHPLPNPRKDNGSALINLIQQYRQKLVKEQIAASFDGPYVLYKKDSTIVYNIRSNTLEERSYSLKEIPLLAAQTDQSGKFLSISIKDKLEPEPSEYEQPSKIFALSDIEGNFDALRKLLQNNHIINDNFDWTFGNGHLVFTGDMFDRGEQVIECLWLLYSLEEKAKSAGGYVHFILGNHEIMNLQGDNRYTMKKYKNNAAIIGETITRLFGENTELGKWLRTKNIMEKIGNVLFVHGGISPQINRLPLTITEINSLVRPYLSGKIDSSNQQLLTLFDSKRIKPVRDATSPFWFRGYYEDRDNPYSIPTFDQIDSTLLKFGVNKIVTGHTIIAFGDKITSHYEGKVINTDTHHSKGLSEALLIESLIYYRADSNGKKMPLFTSNSNPLTTSGIPD